MICILKFDYFLLDDYLVFFEGNSSGGGSGGQPSGGGPSGGRPPENSSQHFSVPENNKRKEYLDDTINDIIEIATKNTNEQISIGKFQPKSVEESKYLENQLRSVFYTAMQDIAKESNKKFTEIEDYGVLHARLSRYIKRTFYPTPRAW